MDLRVELHGSLEALPAADWDALTGDNDPFVEYAFLRALETSGSVGDESGWMPVHVTAWSGSELVGALPLYAKEHSYGEYIFDFAWARAAAQSGVRYYPKLVSMAPFTPATGRRFLIADGEDRPTIADALVQGARAAADEIGASSIHLLFLTEEERELAKPLGLRPRLSLQFHWHNAGYRDFSDYLSRFRSRKRKQVLKERRAVADHGLRIEVLGGSQLGDVEWRALRRFYRSGCSAHGSHPYLRPEFFEAIRETHSARVLVVMAFDGDTPRAASLNFVKGEHLYGRYWGCSARYEHLHFELCYYRLIEYAIEHGLSRFEAGAQGFHKLQRGLLPAEVHSAHWIRDPGLARAVAEFLPSEAFGVKAEISHLNDRTPFHRE